MLESPPRLVTFDVYGTLVDWESVNRRYLASLLARKGVALDPAELYRHWYYGPRLALASGPFLLYRDLLRRSLQESLRHFGVPVEPEDGADFGAAMEQCEPWPDSVDVLAKLGRRYVLAAISNSQHDIIRHALTRLGSPFTYVVTGEDAGAYKPDPRPFELTLQKAGVGPADTVHIAQSQFADLPRSTPMGLRTAWINRAGEVLRPDVPEPNWEFPDLWPVLELLGCD